MWMLTKFAMIFFIGALALILLGFANIEKEGLCNTQAQRVSTAVSTSFSQVINAPVEDERKVFPLEPVLSVGKVDYSRYGINVTHRVNLKEEPPKHFLLVEVNPASERCGAGRQTAFKVAEGEGDSEGINIHFVGDEIADHTLSIEPSNPKKRSKYIVMIKCRTKEWPFTQHFFIEDCEENDPEKCLGLGSQVVDECCGWALPDPACPAPDNPELD